MFWGAFKHRKRPFGRELLNGSNGRYVRVVHPNFPGEETFSVR